jgi:hypothetical protein
MREPVKNSTPEEREKRLAELKTYLSEFRAQIGHTEQVDIQYGPDSAEIINSLYYRFADELIRPTIDSGKIQNFKIASTTEMVILLASPIVMEDAEQAKFFNARLAFYTALRFVLEWNHQYIDIVKCQNVIENDEEVGLFLDEHFRWLFLLDPNYYNPIFLNGQVWRLFFYLLKEKSKLIA